MRNAWMFAAGLVGVIGLAQAHEEPIDTEWCEGGRVVLLGKFTLHGNQLQRYANYVEENGVCPGGDDGVSTKTCGQFDDEYGVGRSASSNLCSQFAYRVGRGDDGTVKPIFYEPASFRDGDPNHHELYSVKQGVVFACGLCEMPVERRETKQLERKK
ncbi:hypothetical protein L2725_20210 [Shewanella corallii]|uniref:Uncharacterized protein n=1 Tax=Shewanella corallii TaxID=560080 RepID=A0ABT0NCC4_9GAMM|nr:hypothetical protein [Shewanella corallii]MCL2916069.1 hypothetical protein [Shewanella corallii]